MGSRRVVSAAAVMTICSLGYAAPRSGQVDAARLAAAGQEPGQWLVTGRDGGASYYSPLNSIDRETVKDLGFAWESRLGTRRGLQATPLVVDGTMYTSGNWGVVYALDAANGKERWHFDPRPDPQVARYEVNDVVNKGVAVWQGRLYVVSPDCKLFALDAAAGTEIWKVDTLEKVGEPYVCTGAPQLAGELVVVGNAGGDTSKGGLRGYVTAFDLRTGKFSWRFHTVPSLSDRDPTPEMQVAARTWDPKRDPTYGGGGTVWGGMAYDPTLKLVYLGTGNASPYGAPRDESGTATDNLYAASIVALHVETGRLAWYYQTTPGDRWDFDASATLVLADLMFSGKKRQALMQANKNGYFYAIDRKTGKPISIEPYTYLNWSTGVDANFRPTISTEANYRNGPKLIYPSISGAHSWQPMAFSPRTGLVYIPAIDAPNIMIDLARNPGATIKFVDESTYGVAFVLPDRAYNSDDWRPLVGSLPKVPQANPKTNRSVVRGVLKAFDPIAGTVVWEQQTSEGYLLVDGGTLATGGDLVFAGREDGRFVAYDARTGTVLKVLDTGTPMMAAPMTYEVKGVQYVAIMGAHGGGYLGSFVGTAAMKFVNEGRVLAFRLGGNPQVPKPSIRVDEPLRQPPAQSVPTETIAAGSRLFTTWCARCHSLGVPGVTPDLSRLGGGIENSAVFDAIVLKGALVARGMARFDDVLSVSDTDAIRAFLVDTAWQNYRRR